ncbi:MAG: membrane-bound O-acyltransferase family protein [Planctomycetota bacterium]|nr:membrane-bound O-acyltransferase family protein [Planctomycetota bacterium]
MLLTSYVFLYGFLPIFLGAYYLLPKAWRPWIIAIASYIFYGWWRPDFVLLMWVSTVVDYSCGRGIVRDRGGGQSGRRFVLLSCVSNLGLLAYFKYANFGIESLNSILATMGHDSVSWTAVVLPVGISFYTFQTLSYTIDVYRKDAQPAENFGAFACYVSMFPQLVAGPIVRYRSIDGQLRNRTHTFQKAAIGVLIFQAGLAKKVLLADTFAVAADAGFAAGSLTTLEAWVAALSYTFQIYFDFSGYSDMAIGLGLMIGFQFPVNFDRPYISQSIGEFWRRWHISLSSFLRDYLYVPLGGNRKGSLRTYVNLALTMLLGGLWHGAAWTFVAWGAYQGFWLILERLSGNRTLLGNLPRPIKNAVTFILIVFGWVLFRADSMGAAARMMGSMIGFGGETAAGLLLEWTLLQSIAFVAAPLIVWRFRTTQAHAAAPRPWWIIVVFGLFLVSLLHLHRAADVPFLYFQF